MKCIMPNLELPPDFVAKLEEDAQQESIALQRKKRDLLVEDELVSSGTYGKVSSDDIMQVSHLRDGMYIYIYIYILVTVQCAPTIRIALLC